MARERINPWSWHGLPWGQLRPRDRANEHRTTLYAFLWIFSLAAIRVPYELAALPAWSVWALAALSLWFGFLFVRSFYRMLREADELLRIVQLEGLALGFGAGLVCGMTAAFTMMPPAPWVFLAFIVPMVFAYGTRVIVAAYQAARDAE